MAVIAEVGRGSPFTTKVRRGDEIGYVSMILRTLGMSLKEGSNNIEGDAEDEVKSASEGGFAVSTDELWKGLG